MSHGEGRVPLHDILHNHWLRNVQRLTRSKAAVGLQCAAACITAFFKCYWLHGIMSTRRKGSNDMPPIVQVVHTDGCSRGDLPARGGDAEAPARPVLHGFQLYHDAALASALGRR